jgi:hypothetical protein
VGAFLGYTKIYSNPYAFAALKADGSIKAWGDFDFGGGKAPAGKGFIRIYSNAYAFAALKADGSEPHSSPHDVIEPSSLRAAKA